MQDLSRVHRRYITVSNRFKSAWTFHQFIQGLRKVFTDAGPQSYSADFQTVYNRLKEASQKLNETTAGEVAIELESIVRDLQPLTEILIKADEQISPGLLRAFFERVRNYDDNILTQLVKFYLFSSRTIGWSDDRLDKSDFLCTKIAEDYDDTEDVYALRDRTSLGEIAEGFLRAMHMPPPSAEEIEAHCDQITAVQKEIQAVESIDEINRHRLVDRYRSIKHELAGAYFETPIFLLALETNLVLKNHVRSLYRRDEQRIVAEYQHVFELERDTPVDEDLASELADFRSAVDEFEGQLQGENIRLSMLGKLRNQVRDLVPKLEASSVDVTGPFVPPPEAREIEEESELPAKRDSSEGEYVAEQFEAIVSALDDTNPTFDPKKIALQPDIFSLGLSPREIVAYRRLFGKVSCHQELENFLLLGAALRARIESEVDEIKGILDDSAITGESPVLIKARKTTVMGSLFVRRFDHYLDQTVQDADGLEAKSIQMLKMRMMRAYSGLWLMVHRF